MNEFGAKVYGISISDFGDKSALLGAASHFFGQKVLLGLDQES